MVTATVGDDVPVGINRNRLFWLSCISLIVTAMTFAIRAGILGELSTQFALTDTQLGWVNGMAFLGFPLAMLVFGYLYNALGPRLIMILAFVGHLLGLVLTITAGGFLGLLISTFFIGFANGSVEAACNPMISEMYKDDKTKWLNRFHVWFPGGIAIGALISYVMGEQNLAMGWQAQIAVMIVPTLIYGFMIFTTKFPDVTRETNRVKLSSIGLIMMAAIFALLVFIGTPNALMAGLPGGFVGPLLIVLLLAFFLTKEITGRTRDALLLVILMAIMSLTATSELGTQQWVERIIGVASGGSGLIILAMITTIMALGRFFAGPLIHALNPLGVLLFGAVVTALGLFLMATQTGAMLYVAAAIFAVGVCYFWPTMIGVTAEYAPRSGALGMSLVGAAGMFGLTIWNPVIGGWIDNARKTAEETGLTGDAVELAAGQGALSQLVALPIILIISFAIMFALRKSITRDTGEKELVHE